MVKLAASLVGCLCFPLRQRTSRIIGAIFISLETIVSSWWSPGFSFYASILYLNMRA
jgi:hypothetical protein